MPILLIRKRKMAKNYDMEDKRDRALEVMYARSEREKKNNKGNKNKKDKKALAKPGRKLEKKTAASIITAVLLVGAAIALFFLFKGEADRRRDRAFDYLKYDLSEYIGFPADKSYKDFTVDIALAKPRKENEDGTGVSDVKDSILRILYEKRKLVGDGAKQPDAVVGAGDTVDIWYRGYLIDPETGKEIALSSMSNLGSESCAVLGIGSGDFIPGFELGLVGINTANLPRFEKITSGTVDKDKHIAYVNYTVRPKDSTSASDKKTFTSVRVDLSDAEQVKKTYGNEFYSAIVGAKIGVDNLSFSATIDGKKYSYSNVKVAFVTDCERQATNGGTPIKTVEAYFPYDYGTDGTTSAQLRNETAYFEVYIDYVQDYEVPEYNEKFIREYLSEADELLTAEQIEKDYEGGSLVEKFELYVWDVLMEDYEAEKEALTKDAIWKYYKKTAKVKKYPASKVNELYNEYESDVYLQFDQEATLLGYDDIDEYARYYLKLSETADWRSYLKRLCESLVKERLILYYIMREEGLVPDESALGDKKEALKTEYLDEYVKQTIEKQGKTEEDYSKEELEKLREDSEKTLFEYYNDEYFTETAYYEIAFETFIKWPTVNELDEGAYPYPSKTETK